MFGSRDCIFAHNLDVAVWLTLRITQFIQVAIGTLVDGT